MTERYVISYIDLNSNSDSISVLYFDSKEEAEERLKQIKANDDYMSELMLSESEYEQFEMDMVMMEKDYGDFFK